ncbi:class I SAM-dependent DNA methyltransferase [Leucothrix pacifica]|uniref:site-specific DNA-methyltransferase (adenine-specific) n=1 Tax=Leucothrix pacifica TaxID=1247513 RepID=A0A317CAD4_9GAMM|nr:DNA methyltransferase [Leucothrix pacifica]PWQ93340.1 SAM-dependent methyltransferase [Leucothrix pacifica]
MDLNKLEQKISSIVETANHDEFIYELLLAYDLPRSSITRLKKGDYNQSKNANELIWKKNLFFKVEEKQDLHLVIDEANNNNEILKHHPRFLIVTDFERLLAVDTKTSDSLDIALTELSENYAFFLPWAGMEKTQIQNLNLADIKAAEKLAQLYDIIIQENHIESDQERHGLNIFLSRLLFCFFAEDTGIFEKGQFTNAIASHTQEDGSDLQDYLITLFNILNVKTRDKQPKHLKDFPYVNGGLFAVEYPAPRLNTKARKIIIDSGSLDWKEINPDIFGSMLQAVVHSDQRSNMGMHYTSVVNIMKVIEPLFLNDLREQLEKAQGSENKLKKVLSRLYNLRLFDPACGSGNFLIIAYKELCRLEIEVFQALQEIAPLNWSLAKSGLKLTQFYGIELDDFAHETAKLSLWLAEHQMNLAFKEVFGSAKPTLPLQDGGNIVCGNATRLDWEKVCPKEQGTEIYIMGNPPYVWSNDQSTEQKLDMKNILGDIKSYKYLDYICCWFRLSSNYTTDTNIKYAFVSTNSITQGQQVSIFWPNIYSMKQKPFFAHQSFKWGNNAKHNAGVTCVIIGICSESDINKKLLYSNDNVRTVKNINAYLLPNKDVFINKRNTQISQLPKMTYGNKAVDGGNLFLTPKEKNDITTSSSKSHLFIKRVVGATEFLYSKERWCLWIKDAELAYANSIPLIEERINQTKLSRLKSKDKGAQLLAARPHQFRDTNTSLNHTLLIPSASSERRTHLPIGMLDNTYIVTNRAHVIYDGDIFVFSILSSRMHLVWTHGTAGRLESRINYSSSICYNNFPFPDISEAQKLMLEDHVFNVLDEREKHSEKTMAELYDPDKMPDGLRQAHHEMDLAVERCYRKKPFTSDEERLEYLFKLYEEMIEAEKKGIKVKT